MVAGDTAPGVSLADFNLEFRCSDDSWYSVRAVLDGDTLIVKYAGFSEGADDRYNAGDFLTLDELSRFRRRFRPVSAQLQDGECSAVKPGTTVCAVYSCSDDDVRFHDAVIEDVHFRKHSFIDGEEECRCIFMLCWLHGPTVGTITTTNVGSICIIQSSDKIDPTVASFLKIATERIRLTSLNCGSRIGDALSTAQSDPCDEKICCSIVGNMSSFESGATTCMEQFSSALPTYKETEKLSNCWIKSEQDIDMGGEATCMERFILLHNLERDLSSKTVVEFIYNQTAITAEACIFPSLTSESYTRGIIGLDCLEDFEKLHKFLNNPNHIIISSSGRPWVIAEKLSKHRLRRLPAVDMTQISQRKFEGTNAENGSKLQVVRTGTQEYCKAKKLRDLFMEFAEHQRGLHRRLALEERIVLLCSTT